MDNQEKIKRIRAHQSCPYAHPLTCGNNSNHSNLIAIERNGKVILKCVDCDYEQNWIPDIVISGFALKEKKDAKN